MPSRRLLLMLASPLLILATARNSEATFLSISAPLSVLSPGQSETISIVLTSTENFTLQSANFAFTFDASRFLVTAATTGPQFFGSGSLNYSFDNASGTLAFTLNGGTPITAGQVGGFATFTLMARANAPAGPGTFDLQATYPTFPATTTTQINGGAIVLNPAPAAGFDARTDAIVTVLAPVPEPSSLVLCGIASMVGLGYRLRSRGRKVAIA